MELPPPTVKPLISGYMAMGGGKTGIQQEQRAVKSIQMCECWLQAVHQCGNIVVRSYFDANLELRIQ